MKADNPQSSGEKSKEELFTAGLKCEMVQISSVRYQLKSLLMLGGAETRWSQKPVAKEALEIKNKMHSYALFFPVLVIAIEHGLRADGDEF